MNKIFFILIIIFPLSLFAQGSSSVKSREGNVDLRVNNNGTIGYNPEFKEGEVVWPKGGLTKYLHGVGFFMSFLVGEEERTYRYSYIPVSGESDFTPGSSFKGSTFSDESLNRVYSSRNYDKYNGFELFGGTGPAWPIWRGKEADIYKQYGEYIRDPELRNRANSEEPLFISDEDIVSIAYNEEFGIEVETRVYLYNDEKKENTVIISFVVKNVFGQRHDRFKFGALFDVDITHREQMFRGLDDDIYYQSPTSPYYTAYHSTELSNYVDTINPGYVSIRQIRNNSGNFLNMDETLNSPRQDQFPFVYDFASDFRNEIEYKSFEDGESGDIITLIESSCPISNGKSGSFTYLLHFSESDETYPNISETRRDNVLNEIMDIKDFYLNQVTNVETSESTGVILSPNPISEGNLTIEYPAFLGENTLIQLFDVNGRNLGTVFEGISKKSNLIEYDISDLQSGVYFIRLTLGDKTVTKKFTIEK